MEIQKFDATQIPGKDKIYTQFGKKIYQRILNSYNTQGYKLYYYKNFELIEITSVKILNWTTWGEQIFFLNNIDHKQAMLVSNKAKQLYDKHLQQAQTVAQMPMSNIYHNILKAGK